MDPFIWSIVFGLPLVWASHVWLWTQDMYPSALEMWVFQTCVCGLTTFVLVWRALHPAPGFWIAADVLLFWSVLWAPLHYRAVRKNMRTYCWRLSVWATPLVYLSGTVLLACRPGGVGDNICLACLAAATVCAAVYAHLLDTSIPPVDMSYTSYTSA